MNSFDTEIMWKSFLNRGAVQVGGLLRGFWEAENHEAAAELLLHLCHITPQVWLLPKFPHDKYLEKVQLLFA